MPHIVMGLAQEACRADRAVIDALADRRLYHLDDGANERARRVVLPAVAARVAHVLDLGFVEMGKLVHLLLGPEAQLVHQFQRIAQGIAALELGFDLAEYFPDLVFDGVGTGGALLETLEVGE